MEFAYVDRLFLLIYVIPRVSAAAVPTCFTSILHRTPVENQQRSQRYPPVGEGGGGSWWANFALRGHHSWETSQASEGSKPVGNLTAHLVRMYN